MLKLYTFVFSLHLIITTNALQASAESTTETRQTTSLEQIYDYMTSLATAEPEYFRIENIGFSHKGTTLKTLIVSSDPSIAKPSLYFNGAHHGDEKTSTKAVMSIVSYIHQNLYDKIVLQVLENYQLIFQPVVNPDGYVKSERNSHLDLDLNRDYPINGQFDGDKFVHSETRSIHKLFKRHNIVGALAYHSGMTGVLWPWGYTRRRPPHENIYRQIATSMSKSMGFGYAKQSYFDYPTQGEFIDYAYNFHGAIALTVEISTNKILGNNHDRLIRRSVASFNAFIDEMMSIQNNLKKSLKTKKPLQAGAKQSNIKPSGTSNALL